MNIKSKPQVAIAQPCHEDWNKMTPEAQGRFCGSCSKIVVDFTKMADHEVIAFFEHTKGKTCGKFTKDQLARPLEKESTEPKVFYQKWLIAAVLSGLLVLSPETNMAKMASTNDGEKTETVHGGSYYSHALPEFVEFNGVVMHQGEPLSRVAIYIAATESYVFTKKDGSFSFKIKTYDYQKSRLATFSKKGYEDLYRNLDVVQANGEVELESTKDEKTETLKPQVIKPQKDSNEIEKRDSTEVTAVRGSDGVLQPTQAFEIIYELPMIDPGLTGFIIYTPETKMPYDNVIERIKTTFRHLFD